MAAAGRRAPEHQRDRKDGSLVAVTRLIEQSKAGDGPEWKVGTMLAHPRWKAPRSIEEINGPEIKLRSPVGCGYSWVRRLPANTEVVE